MDELQTVLIVDDVRTNNLVMAQCLKGLYQIREASNGHDCLREARRYPLPSLILLDVIMPVLDGYEVCRLLKSDPVTADIPVIFVTAKDADEDEQKGLELGAVDYITKPIRPAIVRARVSTHVQLKQHRDKLQFMALHDQLTGLYNRRYFQESAEQRLAKVCRNTSHLSVVMIDVDHFKKINDEHGHDKGDLVLQQLAALLKANTRREDVVARIGGEEFVILMDCALEAATYRSQRLLHLIVDMCPAGLKISCSLGVVQANAKHPDFSYWLKRADQAVYQAKSRGRNCVVVAGDETSVLLEEPSL
ncbi:GGDEF domain-containing response regulator [Shewanella cyperi]|uniref:GGDEF domain-containing response regulator n=1 Tax=Shewanella cyperi TaxID=2814292 RepID=UPI001A93ECBE|nr:diguanylate cyclase [Shewanella cyperi]QSX40929.1 diguanylate cyclase [Shewanella cyperi]